MARTTTNASITTEKRGPGDSEPALINTIDEQPKGFPIVPKDHHVATVQVALGLTVNMGRYESARVDVSLTVPCDPRRIDQVADQAKQWVEQRVVAEAKKIRKSRNNGSSND